MSAIECKRCGGTTDVSLHLLTWKTTVVTRDGVDEPVYESREIPLCDPCVAQLHASGG